MAVRTRAGGHPGGITRLFEDGALSPSSTPAMALETAWQIPSDLREIVSQGASVELLYVHVPFATDLEGPDGEESYEQVMDVLARTLRLFLSELGCAAGLQRWPADDFVAWIADQPRRPSRVLQNPTGLEIAAAIFLREALVSACPSSRIRERVADLTVTRARVPFEAERDAERVYARTVRKIQADASDPVARELQRSVSTMDRALHQRAFTFHYQPIVDVNSRRTIAYEALCRGTLESLLYPDVIFTVAERCDRIWDLGRVLRDLIAVGMPRIPNTSDGQEPLLFMNVHPRDIEDPVFLEQTLSGGLARHAERVVIELTERAAIRDYRRVKELFATLRRHGFRLAIDDLGSGYAGLTSLAELEPDYIKFDMALVRDLHRHPVKQRLVQRMTEFAGEIGARTISEGIECFEERDAVLAAGCHLMQGYFFARPAAGFVEVAVEKMGPVPADVEPGSEGVRLAGV